jgi:hypothetical protein
MTAVTRERHQVLTGGDSLSGVPPYAGFAAPRGVCARRTAKTKGKEIPLLAIFNI